MNIINKLTLRHLRLNRSRTIITAVGIIISVAMVCTIAGYVYSFFDFSYESAKRLFGDFHAIYYGMLPEHAQRLISSDIIEEGMTAPTTVSIEGAAEEGRVDVYVKFYSPVNNFNALQDELLFSLSDDNMLYYNMYGMSYNTFLMEMDGIRGHGGLGMMDTMYILMGILIVVVAGSSIIVIANGFNISAADRVRQFGMLKSVGATGRQIARAVLTEALLLAVISIPIGILAGFALQWSTLEILNNILINSNIISGDGTRLNAVFHIDIMLITTAAALVTIFLSAWRPAMRAAKMPAIESIRQAQDIFVRKREYKTSRLTQRLFGFEGTLASKSLKRSRGKYRAAVASLAVSIVLFVSVSSFVGMMNESVASYYDDTYNVSILAISDMNTYDTVARYLSGKSDITFSSVSTLYLERDYSSISESEREFITDDYAQYLLERGFREEHITDFTFHPYLTFVPDDEFETISQGMLIPGDVEGIPGIVMNTSGMVIFQNRYTTFTPFKIPPGYTIELYGYLQLLDWSEDTDTVTVNIDSSEIIETTGVTVIGETDRQLVKPPHPGELYILLSESDFRTLVEKYHVPYRDNDNWISIYPPYSQFYINAEDSAAFCEDFERAFSSDEYRRVYVRDLDESRQQEASIMLVVSLAGYGFIALLSLIAVTSVIATISTGMALRRREFAMLYSTGMTDKGLSKMLNLESLLYGIRAIIIGVPIGVAASYAIYAAFGRSLYLLYSVPWLSILIACAAVMLISFATMNYSKRKLRGLNIVETIRLEVA